MNRNKLKAKGTPAISHHDFQSLFVQHYPGVLRHVYFLTQDRSAAEDLTQESFLKLYRSGPVSLANPRAWLHKVATNLTYNYLKAERSHRGKESIQEPAITGDPGVLDETVICREETDRVRAVLDTLPGKERVSLLLRYSGFSYEEIAGVLQIPKSSVGKTLARAQAKFKEAYLSKEGSGR